MKPFPNRYYSDQPYGLEDHIEELEAKNAALEAQNAALKEVLRPYLEGAVEQAYNGRGCKMCGQWVDDIPASGLPHAPTCPVLRAAELLGP